MTIAKIMGIDLMRVGEVKIFPSKGLMSGKQNAIHSYAKGHGKKFETLHIRSSPKRYSGLSVTRIK